LRSKYHADPVRGQKWHDSCVQEVKFRASRQKHFGTLRDKVDKGEITQEYMDTCLNRIDTAYAIKQYNRASEPVEKDGNTSTGDREGTRNSHTSTSSSSVSDSSLGQTLGVKESGFKAATASTMQSRIPIRAAAPIASKEKDKQAYDKDEVESDDTVLPPKVLRSLADEAFRTLYGCPLPSCIKLDQLKRFMSSLPLHVPEIYDMVEINKLIEGGDEFSELVVEIFEKYVSKAEWNMEHRHLADAKDKSLQVENCMEAETLIFQERVNKGKQKQSKEAGTSRDEVSNIARPAKGEPSLFKTMAKAKVESKLKEDGPFKEEPMSGEMRARSLLASGSSAQAAKAHKAASNAKSNSARGPAKNGASGGTKKKAPKDNIRYRVKLAEKDGEMTWPPMVESLQDPGLYAFLSYGGGAS
jgi:hypothetical protein